MPSIKALLLTTVTLIAMDLLWLGVIAKPFYIEQAKHLLRMQNGTISANFFAAVFVYIFLLMGIFLFVVPKAGSSCLLALGWGALFGLVCYGTYDFTNLAVIANWPLWMSIVDVLWGCVICGVASCVAVASS